MQQEPLVRCPRHSTTLFLYDGRIVCGPCEMERNGGTQPPGMLRAMFIAGRVGYLAGGGTDWYEGIGEKQ